MVAINDGTRNIARPVTTQPTQTQRAQNTQPAGWVNSNAAVVSQIKPQGADANYRDGAYNCAGAVAATAAHMMGTVPSGQTDASLISDLSAGRTTSEGTTPGDLIGMLQDVGARVDQPTVAGASQTSDVDAALAKGDKVVAQVGIHNNSTGNYDSHYVIVDGKDKSGNYLIKDPLKGQYTATPAQLSQAIDNAPGLGGVLIPFGPADASTQQAGQGGSTKGFAALANTSSADDEAFQANNSALQGTDTSWKPYVTDSFAPAGAGNDPRNQNYLFGQAIKSNMGAATATAPSQIAGSMSPQQFADFVSNKLRDKDPTVRADGQNLFKQLEGSNNAQDRQAFDLIVQQYADQHGIGLRTGYDPYGG